ncbi:MAG: hypothetical protein M4579_001522 [Chaenotheca gracillima]|nr:MAG: hypothetical protein M4579_001522 [Chaenotheca gracillima]
MATKLLRFSPGTTHIHRSITTSSRALYRAPATSRAATSSLKAPINHTAIRAYSKRNMSVDGIDAWKQRPPYSIHKPEEHFQARYNGSCHCGKVTYQLSREKPLDAKYCHCTTCQVLHGSPLQWAAIFHKEDINFTNGHHDLTWYESVEKTTVHKLPCKVTCSYCRTPIMDEGRNMILLYPALIKFESAEDKKNFEPTCHMFYSQRVIDVPDGKPKWTGLNESSERMEESPVELKRKRDDVYHEHALDRDHKEHRQNQVKEQESMMNGK